MQSSSQTLFILSILCRHDNRYKIICFVGFVVVVFSSPEAKAQVSFSHLRHRCRWHCRKFSQFYISSSFLEPLSGNFNQTMAKIQVSSPEPPGKCQTILEGIQVCSNEGPFPFPRGDTIGIHLRLSKIFLPRTCGPILTKLGTKHSLVKGIKLFFKYKGSSFSQNSNIEKKRN